MDAWPRIRLLSWEPSPVPPGPGLGYCPSQPFSVSWENLEKGAPGRKPLTAASAALDGMRVRDD